MSKLIKKCCVCGTITEVITQKDGDNSEKVSHGYCGKGCANFTPVQIMVWDSEMGCRTLDQGHMTEEGRVYYKMEAVDTCCTYNKKEQRIDSLFWNGAMYEIAEFEPVANAAHANRLTKEAVEAGYIVVY